jgi:hypothetical protein
MYYNAPLNDNDNNKSMQYFIQLRNCFSVRIIVPNLCRTSQIKFSPCFLQTNSAAFSPQATILTDDRRWSATLSANISG